MSEFTAKFRDEEGERQDSSYLNWLGGTTKKFVRFDAIMLLISLLISGAVYSDDLRLLLGYLCLSINIFYLKGIPIWSLFLSLKVTFSCYYIFGFLLLSVLGEVINIIFWKRIMLFHSFNVCSPTVDLLVCSSLYFGFCSVTIQLSTTNKYLGYSSGRLCQWNVGKMSSNNKE